jgi:hypothetical protein
VHPFIKTEQSAFGDVMNDCNYYFVKQLAATFQEINMPVGYRIKIPFPQAVVFSVFGSILPCLAKKSHIEQDNYLSN